LAAPATSYYFTSTRASAVQPSIYFQVCVCYIRQNLFTIKQSINPVKTSIFLTNNELTKVSSYISENGIEVFIKHISSVHRYHSECVTLENEKPRKCALI